jgi:hypothetical protein
MPANVTAEHRVQLSQAAGYLSRCVRHAELADDNSASTGRSQGALIMLSYVLDMPIDYLARLSSEAKEVAGLSPTDSFPEITLWLERYANHLADALYVALTPGD